jgi:hypothetical protein
MASQRSQELTKQFQVLKVQQNANRLRTMHYTHTNQTVMVDFSTKVVEQDGTGRTGWRRFQVLMEAPTHAFCGIKTDIDLMEESIKEELFNNFEAFGAYTRDGQPLLYLDPTQNHQPLAYITGITRILSPDAMADIMITETKKEREEVMIKQEKYFEKKRMFGWIDEMRPGHHRMRYYIPGTDMQLLLNLAPQGHRQIDCDGLCVYNMLEARNQKKGKYRGPMTKFAKDKVLQFFNANGHPDLTLKDGVDAEMLQLHAMHHGYTHVALDITRRMILFWVPPAEQRDHHHAAICYTCIDGHCIPFTDPDVIKSIVQSAMSRMGRRQFSNFSSTEYLNSITFQPQPQTETKKRGRSLDRSIRASYPQSRADLNDEALCGRDAPADLEIDDREEEEEDNGEAMRTGSGKERKRREYPCWPADKDRFHFLTLENNKELIQQKLHPDYKEDPTNAHLMHYFILTDTEDVEELYNYCLRVLGWDPTSLARHINGRCKRITNHNIIWAAHPQIHHVLDLHGWRYPKVPFRMSSLSTYAFKMFAQELLTVGRYPILVWDCMSQYPPNLQRLLDNHNPYHRPKLSQCTYQKPYDIPTKPTEAPKHLIPEEHRHRIDLIRSYTAMILQMANAHEQYPIHDITNRVVPYDEALHGSIPIGHYLIDAPTFARQKEEKIDQKWAKMPYMQPGEARMMSHLHVRDLLRRGLIQKTDLRLVCLTDPLHQDKYGLALTQALQNFVYNIYHHENLQDPKNPTSKHLVNQLIGLFNGTSIPCSGMRYTFRSFEEMYQLMVKAYMNDGLSRIRLMDIKGCDPTWGNTNYQYYQMTSSGLTHRHFHFQPIYNMILEKQALTIYDLALPIPMDRLIQINIDAIEYFVPPTERNYTWAADLRKNCVDAQTYKEMPIGKLYNDDFLGRYKDEAPKPEEKWKMYYYHYNRAQHTGLIKRIVYDHTLDSTPQLVDPENMDWVCNWHSTLRRIHPKDGVKDPLYLKGLLKAWFNAGHVPSDEHGTIDRSGLILTGCAGTGKTYILKQIYDHARSLNLNVFRCAFTHAACVQLGPDALTLSALFGLDYKSDQRCLMTMSKRFQAHLRNMNIDILMIDEISMIPLDILECLMMFHRVSTRTRFILSGDFHQLAPVEPGWKRPDDYNYFDQTDIYPYLVYDRVLNQGGHWMELTECMRTNDPLLQRIAQNPLDACKIDPRDFPLGPNIQPWRFICHTNHQRKACNWYCMHQYLTKYPDRPAVAFPLHVVYAKEKMHFFQKQNNATSTNTLSTSTTTSNGSFNNSNRFNQDYYFEELDKKMERFMKKNTFSNDDNHPSKDETKKVVPAPRHWEYLQDFTYAEGMEVVSRNTLRRDTKHLNNNNNKKPIDKDDLAPLVVNNRRAIIHSIDEEKGQVVLQWKDLIRRDMEATDMEDSTVTLTFYDFAFNFVPGFCITAHMAQGETIREHYAILEWEKMKDDNRMAYVALTRASQPEFLHIITDYFADPWNTKDTSDVYNNVLRKVYYYLKQKMDPNHGSRLLFHPPEDMVLNLTRYLESNNNDKAQQHTCVMCMKNQYRATRFNPNDYKCEAQFRIIFAPLVKVAEFMGEESYPYFDTSKYVVDAYPIPVCTSCKDWWWHDAEGGTTMGDKKRNVDDTFVATDGE